MRTILALLVALVPSTALAQLELRYDKPAQKWSAEALPLGLLDLCARGQPGQTALTGLKLLQPITACSAPGAQPI